MHEHQDKREFTPGPWIVDSNDRTLELEIDSINGEWVATIIQNENTEANARLIASAPDLLEALDSILNAEHRLGHGLTCKFCIDKAKRAIAKAKE